MAAATSPVPEDRSNKRLKPDDGPESDGIPPYVNAPGGPQQPMGRPSSRQQQPQRYGPPPGGHMYGNGPPPPPPPPPPHHGSGGYWGPHAPPPSYHHSSGPPPPHAQPHGGHGPPPGHPHYAGHPPPPHGGPPMYHGQRGMSPDRPGPGHYSYGGQAPPKSRKKSKSEREDEEHPPPYWQGGPPPPHGSHGPPPSQYHPGPPPGYGGPPPPPPPSGWHGQGPGPHAPPPPPHGPSSYSQGTWTSKSPPRPRSRPDSMIGYRSEMDMSYMSMSNRSTYDDDGAGSSAGGSTKDKGRGSYKCGRCGVPKKGHICPYQPKLKRRPEDPPPEMRSAAVQVEMDEFMTLRRLNLRIQGFPESYATEPYMGESMVVGEPRNMLVGPPMPQEIRAPQTMTLGGGIGEDLGVPPIIGEPPQTTTPHEQMPLPATPPLSGDSPPSSLPEATVLSGEEPKHNLQTV